VTAGRIHSIESMGLSDGPGVRTVVFFQGCALRCSYCHNPDTWVKTGGSSYEPESLFQHVSKNTAYFRRGGGVTCSGGEPLLQPDFLLEFLKLCRANGIHTALDTSGTGLGVYDEILRNTDLVLLDVKHFEKEPYEQLTGGRFDVFEDFADAVEASGMPLWIRHVVVPGITDSPNHIRGLADYLKRFSMIQRVELLPYHRLGVPKYNTMGIPYPLEGTLPMDVYVVRSLEKYLIG